MLHDVARNYSVLLSVHGAKIIDAQLSLVYDAFVKCDNQLLTSMVLCDHGSDGI